MRLQVIRCTKLCEMMALVVGYAQSWQVGGGVCGVCVGGGGGGHLLEE